VVAPNVLASYYSPKRAGAYSQQIEFLLDPSLKSSLKVVVRRRSLLDTALSYCAEGASTEAYVAGENHEDALQRVVQSDKWSLSQVVTWAQVWLNVLRGARVSAPSAEVLDWIEYDVWLPGNYLDAIPRNLLLGDSGLAQFIDLEWHEKHPLPLKLVVYRGLLVSVASLTSVAVPEDATLLDSTGLIESVMVQLGMPMTALDYSRFMPIIDGLARRAQGRALGVEPIKTPYTGHMLKVRDWMTKAQFARTTLTLYWKKTAEDSFNENDTIKRNYDLNGKSLALDLQLPESEVGFHRLRLDISGRKGRFFVSVMQLVDAQGKVLWDWGLDMKKLLKMGQLEMAVLPGLKQACMVSTGNDPQFELDLPETVLPQLSGATLRLMFSAVDAE